MDTLPDIPDENRKKATTRKYLKRTYIVTIIMLLVGQAQVVISMQIVWLKTFLMKYYYISLIQFFVSFVSLQFYVFFYHIIERKSTWLRVASALWTYESNTLCIMKPTKSAPYLSLLIALFMVYAMLGASMLIGSLHSKCIQRFALNRNLLILWSERIFVVTSFGIIVCSEMRRAIVEFVMLFIYQMISNVFVVVFAITIRQKRFFHMLSDDWMLVGQLYYLNFFALYMSYVWTTAAGTEIIMGRNYSIEELISGIFKS